MSQIHNSNKRDQVPSKPSQVLSAASIDWFAFQFTDSQGFIDVAFAAVFGTSTQDGEPNVAIVQPETLKQMLTVPHKHILEGVRARIKELRQVAPDVPEVSELGGLEVGDVG